MKPVELTHATWVDEDGRPTKVLIYPEHVFAVLWLPSLRCTTVQATSSAYMTVLESVDEVNRLILEAKKSANK